MKTCSKCQQEKNLVDFTKDKRRKDGYGSWCLICAREYSNALYQRPEQKASKHDYYSARSTELNEKSRQRYAVNKDRYRVAMDQWAEDNRDLLLTYYSKRGACCICHRIRTHLRRDESQIPKVQDFRAWLNQLKDRPCMDCNRTFHPVGMDFDHVRGKKTSSLSQMWSWSRDQVLAEIEKCDLVCANCHRVRTQTRRKLFLIQGPQEPAINLSVEETH